MDRNHSTLTIQHVFQPYTILLVFVIECCMSILFFLITHFYINLSPEKEEISLCHKKKELEIEAKEYELPSTFVKWVKITRETAKIEKAINEMREKRLVRETTGARLKLKTFFKFRGFITCVILYYMLEPTLPPYPLLEISSKWLWPFGRLLSIPKYKTGSISLIGWWIICHRFMNQILLLLSK